MKILAVSRSFLPTIGGLETAADALTRAWAQAGHEVTIATQTPGESGVEHGHYGLNPDETVAPSSSILWPFLLAPFAWFEWHALVPLAFCSLAAVAALFAAGRLLSEISVSASPIPSARSAILLIALIFVLAMPLHALSGMEHLPHVAVTAIAAVGLIILVTRSEPP